MRRLATIGLLAGIAFLAAQAARASIVVPCAGVAAGYARDGGLSIDPDTTCLSISAGGDTFNGLLQTGASALGAVILHGRNTALDGAPRNNHPNAVVVRQMRKHLNTLGITTLSIETPNIPASADGNGNGSADFGEYDDREPDLTARTFARVNAAIQELADRALEDVVLAGFSMGSRYATAAAAAANQGVLGNSLPVAGLIGVGMYNGGGTQPTSGPGDIHGYVTLANLPLVISIPVLDVFGDRDSPAAADADARKAAYGGDLDDYTQVALTCPDFTATPYFFSSGGTVTTSQPYALNRCHQLRDGYLQTGSNPDTFVLGVEMQGGAESPFESALTAWVNSIAPVPAPPALLLTAVGILAVATPRRRSRSILRDASHRGAIALAPPHAQRVACGIVGAR